LKTVAVIVLCTACFSLYAGEIQKWVDKDGNIHYGNVPPPESTSETIKIHKEPTHSSTSTPTPIYESEEKRALTKKREALDAERQEREKQQAAVKKSEKKLKDFQSKNYDAKECKGWKAKAAAMKNRDPIGYKLNPDYGEASGFITLYCYDWNQK
jgi:hypothetical protein